MNFTFKKHAKTGRYRSFDYNHTDIKLKGKVVGSINEGTESTVFRLRLRRRKRKKIQRRLSGSD